MLNNRAPKKPFSLMPNDCVRIHLGVVGLGNSGKTVFITSLVDQLQAGGFDNIDITNFEEVRIKPHGCEEKLAVKKWRNLLSHECEWPEKTGRPGLYSCKFRIDGWRLPLELELYDIPGERVTDAAIMDRDFLEWGEKTLETLGERNMLAERLAQYQEVCDDPDTSVDVLTATYKEMLGEMVLDYRTAISPSTFLLDLGGSQITAGTPEEWSETRIVGFDSDSQFAPIPKSHALNKEVVAELRKNYQLYRKRVVKPIFTRLRKCNRLLILSDIPGTLAASVKTNNDSVRMLKTLVKACKPGAKKPTRGIDAMLAQRFKIRFIKRVAMVGTKQDLIQLGEEDQLKDLMDELCELELKNLKIYGVQAKTFSCSSVISTDPPEMGSDHLSGYLVYSKDDGSDLPPPPKRDGLDTWCVSQVPETWPNRWEEGEYTFPEVYPLIPANEKKPPRQEGLQDVFEFLVEG